MANQKNLQYLTTLLFMLGVLSCEENDMLHSKVEQSPKVQIKATLNHFELLEDFELNKLIFNLDTFQILDKSTDSGELRVYHDGSFEYVVLDFWLYGETRKLNYTYWTDRDFNFRVIKKTDYAYDKPYYEDRFTIDSTTRYMTFDKAGTHFFDANKTEISNQSMIDSIRIDLEGFFKDCTKDIELVK